MKRIILLFLVLTTVFMINSCDFLLGFTYTFDSDAIGTISDYGTTSIDFDTSSMYGTLVRVEKLVLDDFHHTTAQTLKLTLHDDNNGESTVILNRSGGQNDFVGDYTFVDPDYYSNDYAINRVPYSTVGYDIAPETYASEGSFSGFEDLPLGNSWTLDINDNVSDGTVFSLSGATLYLRIE